MDLSPDGRSFAVALYDRGVIEVWDVGSLRRAELQGGASPPADLREEDSGQLPPSDRQ